MNRELVIPREQFETKTEQKLVNYTAGENFDSIKSDDWVIISGFPRHLISMIRPKLEYDIGPIDHWINGYVKEGHDVYFVSFRDHKTSKKSLQFNDTFIFGNLVKICPCFDIVSSKMNRSRHIIVPNEEYYNNSNINVHIY
ncbi:hypothetical protein OIY81_2309 [Cryptosporidium canis]|uniref:RRM Nup35-type domain-containing protein n=1 Tax=Cryptosporidium canis TaxID=195482 RepID=A0ABQ8P414_9CRYT|nr:hypothetical protein OJ252_2873 [Cryptosporidium canis]KAJ1609601.1 hypothetical protein OIY81_2309 [Cryptosporidium canis]